MYENRTKHKVKYLPQQHIDYVMMPRFFDHNSIDAVSADAFDDLLQVQEMYAKFHTSVDLHC